MEKEHYLHSDQHIENNIANGWEFKFGDYISRGFEYTNKQAGAFIGFTALFFLIAIVVGLIPIGGALANAIFLSNCLMVGYALGIKNFQKTGTSDFNSLWDGFKFIGPISILGLVTIAISVVGILIFGLVIGFSFIGDFMELQKNPGDQEAVMAMIEGFAGKWGILVILGILLGFLFFPLAFAPFFIIFHGKDAIKSIELSYKLVAKNWPVAFAFYIIAILIMVIGSAITCGLGALYLFPVFRNMMFAMYEDMTGMDLDNDAEVNFTDSETIDG